MKIIGGLNAGFNYLVGNRNNTVNTRSKLKNGKSQKYTVHNKGLPLTMKKGRDLRIISYIIENKC